MHHDGSNSTYGKLTAAGRQTTFAFGHNWVVLAIWVPLPWNAGRGLAIPVLFRLYRGRKRCPASHYRKRTELGAELVLVLARWVPAGRTLHVVGDSEYASRTVVRTLPSSVEFTGSMAMDAALYSPAPNYSGKGRPRTKGRRLPSPKQLAASGAKGRRWRRVSVTLYGREVALQIKTIDCLWYTVAEQRPVRVVLTRPLKGSLEDRAYFSTDLSLTPEEILVRYARRWSVEATFRNAKQSMGISHPQNGWWRRSHGARRPGKRAGPNPRGNRGKVAVERTVPLFFLAYGITILWYLRHGEPVEDVARAMAEAPWYRHKREPSFLDMLAALRRELWAWRLSAEPRSRVGSSRTRLDLPGWLLSA